LTTLYWEKTNETLLGKETWRLHALVPGGYGRDISQKNKKEKEGRRVMKRKAEKKERGNQGGCP